MRVEDINPVVPPQPTARAPESHEREVKTETVPEGDTFTPTGQLSLNGITAYFSVKNGEKIVFQIVEDATGRIIRQVSPIDMVKLSGAIDEMLSEKVHTTPLKEGD